MTSPDRAILVGLGPLSRATPTPTGTAPLTTTGILNLPSLGTVVTKVLSGNPGGLGGRERKVKITQITTANVLAWSKAPAGAAAPVFTADAVGTSTNGSIVSTPEIITVAGDADLYLVASASSTICQVHVEEV